MPWHPFMVHFPIALLITSGVVYAVSLQRAHPFWAQGAYSLHIAGLGGLILATLSGRQAEADIVHTATVHTLVERHELLGYATLWACALLLVWRYLRQGRRRLENVAFVLVFWAMLGLMVWGGWYGGRLVYEAGAGVAPMRPYLQEQFQREQTP